MDLRSPRMNRPFSKYHDNTLCCSSKSTVFSFSWGDCRKSQEKLKKKCLSKILEEQQNVLWYFCKRLKSLMFSIVFRLRMTVLSIFVFIKEVIVICNSS